MKHDRESMALTLTNLVERSNAIARDKGWYDGGDRNIPEMLALIHSEVSEALEDYRNNCMALKAGDGGKLVGFPSEVADIVIRVADLCGYLGIDLEDAVEMKLLYNASRPHKHGGKKC